jgi:hypothetical protein
MTFFKQTKNIILVLIIAVLSVTIFNTTQAEPIPTTVGYQGYLQENGAPVDGDKNFTFSLYTTQTNGTPIWTETKTLTVSDGLFSTSLGDQVSLPKNINFNQNNYYLNVNVEGTDLLPRQKFDALPFAKVTYGLRASSSAPTSATNTNAGEIYFNTTSGSIYISDGTE